MTRKIANTGSNRSSASCAWEEVEVDSLRPAVRRTRTHPAGKRRTLEDSIREYGILDPITINGANVIVDGHLRVEIARKLGYRALPTIRIAHLSDAELRAYAIAANKLPAVANYNVEELRLEFEEIKADAPLIDLTLTGFTIGEVDQIAGNHAAGRYDDLDEVQEAAPATVPVSQLGDLYALGDHRLICGDSLYSATFNRLMDGDEADCCFTDPPYNVRVNGHVSSSGKHAEFAMASGEMTRPQFEHFLTSALGNIAASLRDGAVAFVCMDHAHLGELLIAGDETFDARLNICVWDKGRGGMGSLWRSQCEHIAVFKKGTAPHVNAVELGKHGRDRTNVWSFPGMAGFGRGRRKALELHPTVKPVALIAEALLDVTGPSAVVLDPFGGSGSTLIACERIGRRARLVELDPVYVDRIIVRWEKLTGREAELLARLEPEPTNLPVHHEEGEE
jgi:hypothetical protein